MIKSKSKYTLKKRSNKTNKTNKSNKIIKTNKNVSRLNILSYNISWESMSGTDKKWALCNNTTDKNNSKHVSVCVNNVASVFDTASKSLDFVTLQEASDYQKLINESPRLQKMKYEIYNSGLDTIVTFWDPKYKLESKITGEFEYERPWMATIFTNDICLVNVHMGHYDTKEQFAMMEKMLKDIRVKIKQDKQNNQNKLRYIISGDFNYDIKRFGGSRNYFTLDNTKLYFNTKHILTCCINRKKHNDHVIDSTGPPKNITIPKVNYMASDHKPILVEV